MVPELRTLLLQIIVICFAARGMGWLFARLRQPRVVGEIVAGVLLGPSLLGWLAPSVSVFVFPAQGLAPLYSLSQIALLLFMFQIGLELDVGEIGRMGRAVALTSSISILAPFLAGGALALFLYPRLANPSVPISIFALFMGTAMSITAFPVLARILGERNLLRSKIGSIAISCAAVNDIIAWCLLALLVVKVRSGAGIPLWVTLAGLLVYMALMIGMARPILSRIPGLRRQTLSADALAFVLLFVFLSAWMTEQLGIHALFGAFLAGVVLPKTEDLARSIINRLEVLSTVLLLPLFFAFTGLRTSVRLLTGGKLCFYLTLIILVAVAGKLFGSALPLRKTGASWSEAFSVGILMNTRGLVELVILNVALDLEVVTPVLFAMMVIMALVTTLMTSPLLDLISKKAPNADYLSAAVH